MIASSPKGWNGHIQYSTVQLADWFTFDHVIQDLSFETQTRPTTARPAPNVRCCFIFFCAAFLSPSCSISSQDANRFKLSCILEPRSNHELKSPKIKCGTVTLGRFKSYLSLLAYTDWYLPQTARRRSRFTDTMFLDERIRKGQLMHDTFHAFIFTSCTVQ